MIFTRMIRSETRLTSNTFSIHFSTTNTPTPAVPLLFPDQNSLYLESLPVIIRQWPPRYLVSWTQQRSTFLRDSVSTTSQTLPFRVFTLRVLTLKFLRCLLDLPQWPDRAPHTWEGAKPETPLTEIWFLPASSNVTSFVDSAMIVFGTKVFSGIACPSWHPNSDLWHPLRFRRSRTWAVCLAVVLIQSRPPSHNS